MDGLKCEACGLVAERSAIFEHHGFRLAVPCACGERVATQLSRSDLPVFEIDWEASTPAMLKFGVPMGRTVERHPGVPIDADTPLWALV